MSILTSILTSKLCLDKNPKITVEENVVERLDIKEMGDPMSG